MNLLSNISRKGLLFDGAMGTMLMKAGLKSGMASEYWNLEKPDLIRKIHEDYFAAGADIVTTNTFGATKIKLKKANLHTHQEEIITNAVKAARAAAIDKFVAGDIGPSGEILAPLGTVQTEELYDNFLEQANYLLTAGVDAFIIETMFDINESLAAIRAVRAVSDLPVFATLTFEHKNNNFATIMGNQAVDSLKQLLDNGADAVGANCSIGSDAMVLLAEEIKKEITGLTIIQPNAGLPETRGSELFYPEDEDFFAKNILKIKQAGVNIVGGCCGTTPAYIRKIKESPEQ